MDRPKSERVEHARKASQSQKSARKDWTDIERDHAEGLGFKRLAKKYGLSIGSLSYHFNHLPGWKPIQQFDFNWDSVKKHILETGCSYKEAAELFKTTDRSIRRQLGPQNDLQP